MFCLEETQGRSYGHPLVVFWETSEEGNRFPLGEPPCPDLKHNLLKLLLALCTYHGLGVKVEVLSPAHHLLAQEAMCVLEAQRIQQILEFLPGTGR